MYRNSGDDKKIRQIIGYQFKNEKLLLQGLTRYSAINEGRQKSDIGHFQRLEFIGDRVLNLVISDILFDNHPNWQEGQLTMEVNKFTHNKGPLAIIAKNLKWGEFLIMGSGEELANLREDIKVLSDAFEALIGAIWVDSNHNYEFIKTFVRTQFKPLGLIDFNKAYEEEIIKRGLRKMCFDVLEVALPEFPEFYGDLAATSYCGPKPQKPLSGLAASMEKFLSINSASDTDGSEEEPQDEESYCVVGVKK